MNHGCSPKSKVAAWSLNIYRLNKRAACAWEILVARIRTYHLLLIPSLCLAACADNGLKAGQSLIKQGKINEGLAQLRAHTHAVPEDVELRQYYFEQRDRATTRLLSETQAAINADKLDEADAILKEIATIDPGNPRAATFRVPLEQAKQRTAELSKAERALAAGQLDAAEEQAHALQAQMPHNMTVKNLIGRIQSAQHKEADAQKLTPAFYADKVTLEFQNAPLRSVFDALSRESGINFVFAPGVPLDREITLFAKETPIANTVTMLVEGNNLKRKVINSNTLKISPEKPPSAPPLSNEGDMVKAFYLTNVDPKRVQTLLETVMSLKNLYIDDQLNLVVVHGSPRIIASAARLIAMVDMAQPEVMLDVEVLEVKHDQVQNLGIQYPNQFTLLNVPPTASSVTTPTGTTVTTPSTVPLTLESLRHIKSGNIAINNPALNLQDYSGDVKLLANPRIRVMNRDDASVQIGEKVPVFTSSTTPTGVVSNSVTYLDVGLKLNVNPTVLLDDNVQIKLALEVSSILNQVSNNGTLAYQIGTRNANTTLRLADGETQILAGLISDEDRDAANKVPGLGSLPLLGRLFSNHSGSRNRTEIVLLITPHLVRNLDPQKTSQAEFSLVGVPLTNSVAQINQSIVAESDSVSTNAAALMSQPHTPNVPAPAQSSASQTGDTLNSHPLVLTPANQDTQAVPMTFPSTSSEQPFPRPSVAPSRASQPQSATSNNQTIVMPPGMKLPQGFKLPPGVTVIPSPGSARQ